MKVNRAVIAMALGLALRNHEQHKNWCPNCGRRPNDLAAMLACSNREFHKQPTSHRAGVSE